MPSCLTPSPVQPFGGCLQVGVIEDQDNREKLGKLLRFYSSGSEDKLTSLDQYISRCALRR